MVKARFDKPYFARLDDAGIEYIRGCLEQGEEFSRLVLSEIELNDGTVYLDVSNEQIQDALNRQHPLSQHVVNGPVKNANHPEEILLDRLRQLDKERGPLALIGEDNGIKYRNTGNRFIPDLPYYKFSEDLWLYVQNVADIKHWHSIDVTGLTIRYAENTHIIATKDLLGNPSQDHSLSSENASHLASSVMGVISGAYHAHASDTYTLWLRNTE